MKLARKALELRSRVAGAEPVQHVDRNTVILGLGADRAGVGGLAVELGFARCAVSGAPAAIGAEAELLALDLDGVLAPLLDQGEEGLARTPAPAFAPALPRSPTRSPAALPARSHARTDGMAVAEEWRAESLASSSIRNTDVRPTRSGGTQVNLTPGPTRTMPTI